MVYWLAGSLLGIMGIGGGLDRILDFELEDTSGGLMSFGEWDVAGESGGERVRTRGCNAQDNGGRGQSVSHIQKTAPT